MGIGVVLAVVLHVAAPQEPDRVTLTDSRTTGEWGVLVPGTSPTSTEFRGFVTAAKDVSVGPIPAGVNNQLIAFRRGNAPRVLQNIWTDQVDTPAVQLSPNIPVPITFRVVNGDPPEQALRVLLALIYMLRVWYDERAGVTLGAWDFEVHTERAGGGVVPPIDFAICDARPMLQQYGYQPDRVNVYIVDRVYGSRANGTICAAPRNFVVLGVEADPTLLAHELAHIFALAHTDGLPQFDGTNLLAKTSTQRHYLTEGQIVRAHVDRDSALNDLLHARPMEPQGYCGSDLLCPVEHKRLWADGNWPPN